MQLDQRLLDELIANPNADLELFKFYRKQSLISSSNFLGKFALHSCELGQKQSSTKSYFGYATSDKIITCQSKLHEKVQLSATQISAINGLYDRADFDFKKYESAVSRHGIDWWTQLSRRIRPGEAHSGYKPTPYSQFEIALDELSHSLFISGLELASTALFQDVFESTKWPLTRRQIEQIVNERLFSKFFWENYHCDHSDDSKTCAICGKKFSVRNSMPIFLGQPALICFGCSGTAPPSEVGKNNTDEYQSIVRARHVFAAMRFVEHYKLVPASNYDCKTAATSSADESLTAEEAIMNWIIATNMPDLQTVKELFGSWAQYLDSAGALEQSRSGQAGYRSFATDGHLCLSVGERQICEFLNQNDIQHEREPLYPRDGEFNKNGLKRADYLIGGCFVELAGRMSKENYAEGMKEKVSLAEKQGFQLIVVTPKELPNLANVFQSWLS